MPWRRALREDACTTTLPEAYVPMALDGLDMCGSEPWKPVRPEMARYPVDKPLMRAQRLELYQLPDYVACKNQSNDYGFDPTEQRTSTFTGMGADINVHDQWAIESIGPIQDRTREHLGQTDKAIIRYRRMLLQAIEDAGATPPLLAATAAAITGPASIDIIGPADDWEAFWLLQDRHRRTSAAWPAA